MDPNPPQPSSKVPDAWQRFLAWRQQQRSLLELLCPLPPLPPNTVPWQLSVCIQLMIYA